MFFIFKGIPCQYFHYSLSYSEINKTMKFIFLIKMTRKVQKYFANLISSITVWLVDAQSLPVNRATIFLQLVIMESVLRERIEKSLINGWKMVALINVLVEITKHAIKIAKKNAQVWKTLSLCSRYHKRHPKKKKVSFS